ncbi:MAG: hypothetical protein M1832_000503 [Thelocarpon impressellum]|nr:MAG: hypothetical protein M1832_000503 [Thelocarpon impressellum]
MALRTDFPPVRACIFDMDGLLIDSEDIYSLCTNTILREHGKPDLPWHIKAQMQGRPAAESGAIFREWANLPLTPLEYADRLSALQRQHFPTAQPLPGVATLISTLSRSPNLHLALATSSHVVNYTLKTSHLPELFSAFPSSQTVLGDDPRIPPGHGKPAPDIYVLALSCINAFITQEGKEAPVKPEECLVFEDSVLGLEAGRRAGMRVVWVPHAGLREEYRGREAEVLAGLAGGTVSREVGGVVGSVDDGWGELLESLQGFDYRRYGIVHAQGN